MLSLHLLYHFLGKATDLTFREGDGNNLPKLSPKCTALISISSIYFKGCPKVFRDSTAHVSSEEFVVLERTHSLCQNSHSVETSCQGVKTQSSIKAKSRGTGCCVCTRFLDLQEKAAFFPFWPCMRKWWKGEKVKKRCKERGGKPEFEDYPIRWKSSDRWRFFCSENFGLYVFTLAPPNNNRREID